MSQAHVYKRRQFLMNLNSLVHSSGNKRKQNRQALYRRIHSSPMPAYPTYKHLPKTAKTWRVCDASTVRWLIPVNYGQTWSQSGSNVTIFANAMYARFTLLLLAFLHTLYRCLSGGSLPGCLFMVSGFPRATDDALPPVLVAIYTPFCLIVSSYFYGCV